MKTSEREALQAKLGSLPKEPAYEPVIGWKPERGKFFFIEDAIGFAMDAGRFVDFFSKKQLCKTKEQAEHLAAVSAARLRVLRRIEELNEGWVADFGNQSELKYYIYYAHRDEVLVVSAYYTLQDSEIAEYCRTEEIAEQVIEECGESWKLWKGIKSA